MWTATSLGEPSLLLHILHIQTTILVFYDIRMPSSRATESRRLGRQRATTAPALRNDTEDGILKISRLRAHWELIPMIRQVVRKGVPGVSTLLKMGFRTMRYQGVTGGLGFVRGFLGIHGRGKECVSRFARAVNQRNSDMATCLLDDDFQPIGFPAGQRTLDLESFFDEVGTHLSVTKLISSGYFTSFTFREGSKEPSRRGVGIFEFHRRTKRIRSAQFYWA